MRLTPDGCGCFPTGRHYPGIAHLLRAVGLASEFDENTPWADMPIAMIDTETTGRDPSHDRVLELAVVIGQRGEVVARHSWLINPGCPIPADSTEVHGIRDEDVRDKPSFGDVCDEILNVLRGSLPAAYNASFDRAFVIAETRRCSRTVVADVPAVREGVEWLDPLIWARHVFADARSRKLGDIAARLGVSLDNAHRATDDAEAALRVMYAMAQDARIPATYGALISQQQRIGRSQDEARLMWRRG